jgi:hypothetical protein
MGADGGAASGVTASLAGAGSMKLLIESILVLIAAGAILLILAAVWLVGADD